MKPFIQYFLFIKYMKTESELETHFTLRPKLSEFIATRKQEASFAVKGQSTCPLRLHRVFFSASQWPYSLSTTQTKSVTPDHRGSGVTEEQVFTWEGRGRAQPLEAGGSSYNTRLHTVEIECTSLSASLTQSFYHLTQAASPLFFALRSQSFSRCVSPPMQHERGRKAVM